MTLCPAAGSTVSIPISALIAKGPLRLVRFARFVRFVRFAMPAASNDRMRAVTRRAARGPWPEVRSRELL